MKTALNYWRSHPPRGNYVLVSNYPDGAAFYTHHACKSSPRKYSGPYGTEEFQVSQYANQLFSSGMDVYLIWIEPSAYSSMYSVAESAPIAQVDPLFVSQDGGVYHLSPNK
jgi:hypothetical protein